MEPRRAQEVRGDQVSGGQQPVNAAASRRQYNALALVVNHFSCPSTKCSLLKSNFKRFWPPSGHRLAIQSHFYHRLLKCASSRWR